MSFAVMAILLPFLAALAISLRGSPMQGARANLIINAVVFCLTAVTFAAPGTGLVHADRLGILFGGLSSLVSLTAAVTNLAYIRHQQPQRSVQSWRSYHALSQLLLGSVLLGLYADNTGLLWIAVEVATICGVLGASLSGRTGALRASWKYLCLGGAGLALGGFGTMLLYLAAQSAGLGSTAMSFTALNGAAPQLNGPLTAFAFIFLLFGYGTAGALVPLHGWLTDAAAASPAPLAGGLAALAPNVALLAMLRFRHLLPAGSAGGGFIPPSMLLIALGLASLLFAAVSLPRQRDAIRFAATAAIGQYGVAAFAFGIGGAAAIFGGLLQLILQTLIGSALSQSLIRAATMPGGAPGRLRFSEPQGLMTTNRHWAVLAAFCLFAMTGLPPSGLFSSEFIIIGQTVRLLPILAIPLGLGLLCYAVSMIRQITLMLSAPPAATRGTPAGRGAILIWSHLVLMLIIAFAMPLALARLLSGIAGALQ